MLVQNISNILAHPKLYTPSTLHELHDSTFDVFLSDLQRTHVTGRLSALAVIVVEPGRAHLNNFNSEKLETCHHRCLDHQRFFSLQNWANRWPDLLDPDATDSRDGGIVGSFGAKVHGVTFSREEGWTRMPSPHGDAPVSLEKNTIDPSNPFVHKLHLGALQVRTPLKEWNAHLFFDNETCYHEPLFIFIEAEDMCPWAFPPPPPHHLHSHLAHSRHCYRQVCLQNIISNDSFVLL